MPDKVKKHYILNTTPMPIPQVYNQGNWRQESNSNGFEFEPEFDGLDSDLF
jgi:hypothetical protein